MIKLTKRKIKTYFIGGINGTGKSRVLSEFGKSNPEFQIINGSEYFMKWLGLKVGDYDSLRSLPDEFKNKELDKMMRFLVQNPPNQSKSLLIGAHFIKIYNGKVTNAVGDWITLFDGLFLIKTNPKEILQRINYDFLTNRRNRKLFPPRTSEKKKIRLLEYYIRKSQKLMEELSRRFKIPYFIIENKNNMIYKTVNTLLECIQKIETTAF